MRWTLPPLAAALLAQALSAQMSFPMLTSTLPTAVRRGTTAEVVVESQQPFGAVYKVLIEGAGVTAEAVPGKSPKSLRLKVTAAADASLGVREFRTASELGVSSLGQLLVVDDPVVPEAPGNGTPATAQPVPVPCVVCGRIEAAENVDYYRLDARAGERLTFEVTCARLQDKVHDLQKHADPLLTLCDESGRELAAADDGLFADPLLTFTAPRDGRYTLSIRDAKYAGDPRWSYALTVTNRPYLRHAYPLAVPLGRATTVTAGGASWAVDALATPGVQEVPLRGPGGLSNPVALYATALPLTAEVEPNGTPATATRFAVPGGVNGRVQERRDIDHLVFAAKKGVAVRLEVFARRFGTALCSPLDAVMDVLAPDGKVLASNDDAVGKDPMLVFAPPADGDYVVRLRDLNAKGGADHVYYLEADFAAPDFTLRLDPSRAALGPGSRTALFVQVARLNGFAGPVEVRVAGLPAGVTATPLTLAPTVTQGLVVLSAAADAKLGAGAVAVTGVSGALTRRATSTEEIYLPGGGRGRFDVAMPAVAVTGPSDIADVQVSTSDVVLKPGEEVTIQVTLKRRADFDKAVTIDAKLRHLGQVFADTLPPGVTMLDGKSQTLVGTGTTGTVTLKAAPDAKPCDPVGVCVQVFVPINFVVKVGYASPVIRVSVAK